MKIASIYGFNAFPPKGGNHLHALQIIRQLQAAGHEVLTLGDVTVQGVQAYPNTIGGAEALGAAADVLYVRIDSNPLGRQPPVRALLRSGSKPCVWEVNSPANENLAYSWLGRRADEGSRFGGVLDGARRRAHAWRQYPGIWREEELRRRLARRAYGAICVSSGMATYAREGLGIANSIVVPNAADPVTHQPVGDRAPLPEDFAGCLKVLYAGSPIYPWQGLGLIARTMRLCAEAGDPIRFVLLVNQPCSTELQTPNAVVHVRVPHDDVQKYLRAVDVGVVVHADFFWSRWGPHGSPMKLFEYMACGRPVIASHLGQLAEVIQPGRNGMLFDNTAEGLRECLLRMHGMANQLPAMGAAARRDIEITYNWSSVAQATMNMLEAAVGAHSVTADS